MQAGGWAVTVKQGALLQAESEDVEGRMQRLPLPPRCSQGLTPPRSELLDNLSIDRISELAVADCERFICLFHGAFHKTTESKFLYLSLSQTLAHRC